MRKIRYNVALWLCRVRIEETKTLGLKLKTASEALVNLRIRGLGGDEQEKGEAFRYFDRQILFALLTQVHSHFISRCSHH